MNLLDMLWGIFRKPTKFEQTASPSITGDMVRKALNVYTTQLWISDGSFRTIIKDDMAQFLASNPVNQRKYVNDSHDCDDFSYELMGDVSEWNPDNTFGIVWGNRVDGAAHAWNFFIDGNMKVWFVEPQNDGIFEPTTEKIWIMIV